MAEPAGREDLIELALHYGGLRAEKFGLKVRGDEKDIEVEDGWHYIFLDVIADHKPISSSHCVEVITRCEEDLGRHLAKHGYSDKVLVLPILAKGRN